MLSFNGARTSVSPGNDGDSLPESMSGDAVDSADIAESAAFSGCGANGTYSRRSPSVTALSPGGALAA